MRAMIENYLIGLISMTVSWHRCHHQSGPDTMDVSACPAVPLITPPRLCAALRQGLSVPAPRCQVVVNEYFPPIAGSCFGLWLLVCQSLRLVT